MKKIFIEGGKIINPEIYYDERGYFSENFNLSDFSKLVGNEFNFVQDNKSFSKKGVFRGLHYQINKPQGKLVQVLSGEVFDVLVDLRKGSNFFGDWMGIHLSSENKKQIWVPPGFAHGFLVLSDFAELFYKVTDYWSKKDERCIRWDDENINIELPEKPKLVSKADLEGHSFLDAEYFL